MISVTSLRNGATFMEAGQPFKVIKYKHTHLSRGAGTIKLKVRNLKTGTINTKTYKGGKQVDDIDVTKKKMQYLYKEDGNYLFMDPVSFEQLEMADKALGDDAVYLKEGEEIELVFWTNPKSGKEEPLYLDLPPKMVFKIAEADPGVKGNSASNDYKDAKLVNGLKVRVPLFINKGDKVRIDTRTGEYVERAN